MGEPQAPLGPAAQKGQWGSPPAQLQSEGQWEPQAQSEQQNNSFGPRPDEESGGGGWLFGAGLAPAPLPQKEESSESPSMISALLREADSSGPPADSEPPRNVRPRHW